MDQDYIVYYHYEVLDSKIVRGCSKAQVEKTLQKRLNNGDFFEAKVDGSITLEEERRRAKEREEAMAEND